MSSSGSPGRRLRSCASHFGDSPLHGSLLLLRGGIAGLISARAAEPVQGAIVSVFAGLLLLSPGHVCDVGDELRSTGKRRR